MSGLWIRDVDLARFDASLFLDVYAVPTTLITVASVGTSGTTLIAPLAAFESAGIQAGQVVNTSFAALEIVGVVSPTELTVSALRCSDDDPPRPVPDQPFTQAIIRTFDRMIDDVEFTVASSLGMDEDADAPRDVRRLMTIRVIERAFAMEAALRPTSPSLANRAALYGSIVHEALGVVRDSAAIERPPGVAGLLRS